MPKYKPPLWLGRQVLLAIKRAKGHWMSMQTQEFDMKNINKEAHNLSYSCSLPALAGGCNTSSAHLRIIQANTSEPVEGPYAQRAASSAAGLLAAAMTTTLLFTSVYVLANLPPIA